MSDAAGREPGGLEQGQRSSGAATALLARERELAELEGALADAFAGRGQFYLLAGESGIGKTSLADALAERARREGATVRWGRAWEGGGAPVFWPWVQVLRGLIEGREPEWLRERLGAGAPWIAQILSELRTQLPEIEPPGTIDTDQARFALFDAVATLLRRVSDERPLALLLDDIHAADAPSLLMLEFVARSIRDAPIFLLAAYQEGPVLRRPEAEAIISELAREGRSIPLRPLEEAELAQLIESRGDFAAPPELVRELHAATDGNPFFASEVVRLMALEGHGSSAAGQTGAPRFRVPDTVRDAVRRRFEPLGEEVLEALQVASVIGREFRLTTLERATAMERSAVVEVLDRAVVAGLIQEVAGAPGHFRFSHGLMRETLYGDLAPAHRIHVHGTVGDSIEELYAGELEARLSELAHHYLEGAAGGYAEKALDYATRAGERAMSMLAYEEADRLLAGALGALDLAGADRERRAELLLALGRAHVRAGHPAARNTLQTAAAAARDLDRPDLLAQAALGFRSFARQPGVVDREVVALLEEALERLPPTDSVLRASVPVRLAVQLFDQGGAEGRREELVEEATSMARRLGDPGALAYVLSNAMLARWGPDRTEEILVSSEEALRIAEQIGSRELAMITRSRRVDLLLELDDMVAVDVEIEALAHLVQEVPEPRARGHVAVQRSRRAAIEGRFEEAERLTAEAAGLAERTGDTALTFITGAQQWGLRWAQGRLLELESHTRFVTDVAPALRVWRAGLARIYCDDRRLAEARWELDRLASDFSELRRNDTWLLTFALCGEVAELVADEQRAEQIYEILVAFEGRNVLSIHGLYAGPVSRYLGLLASSRGMWEQAAEHFAAAHGSATRAGARPLVAMLHMDEARMLLVRGESSDRARARELAGEAVEISRAIGAEGLIRRGEALLGQVPGEPELARAPAAGPEPAPAALRREGDVWVFDYEGRAVRVRDSKGIRHLARLLEAPGVEIHALDLVGGNGERDASAAAAADAGIESRGGGEESPGPALDSAAKAAYRARLEELREEVEEAESFNDPERASRAREEIDFIAQELAGAVGLGGRDRKTGSAAERARVNVTRSIRSALKRIAEYDDDLGRELDGTVRTGVFCAYEPDPRRPVSWSVTPG